MAQQDDPFGFGSAFDGIALDAPVPVQHVAVQRNSSYTQTNADSPNTPTRKARQIVFDREEETPKYTIQSKQNDSSSDDASLDSPDSPRDKQGARYSSSSIDREDKYDSVNLEGYSPSVYTAALQRDAQVYRDTTNNNLVTKNLAILISGIARISVMDGTTTLFTVLINSKEEKLEMIDAKNQLVAYIQKSPLALHPRYKLRLPNGFRVGKCTRRFKPALERKFNYRKADTREIMKMVGNLGSYSIIKNINQRVGTLQVGDRTGVYSAQVRAHPVDVFHIIALLLIGVLDHMSSV